MTLSKAGRIINVEFLGKTWDWVMEESLTP